MVIWTLAKKDLRLLLRDARAMIILLAMPLIFILVLGVSLGENFGQKPAAGLRVSVVDEDEGKAWVNHPTWLPQDSWAKLLLRDLNETADIRVEFIKGGREEAVRLVRSGQRAAVLVLGKRFSKRVERCSFLASGWHDQLTYAASLHQPNPVALALRGMFDESQGALPLYLHDGINPFHRDGVKIEMLDAEILRDPTQGTAAAIIEQMAQGSLLRLIMPWMIGRAFEKIGEPQFIDMMSREKMDVQVAFLDLATVLRNFPPEQKQKLAKGMQLAIQKLYPRYNLTAKTWAALTRESEITTDKSGKNTDYAVDGIGLLRRGGSRYQLLVPSYLVMFAFFLVLTVGWLFVAERRQGTLKRLVVAPLTKAEILIGKMLPCLYVSLFQGFFLLLAGKLVFGMNWGVEPMWLIAVVSATSFAAIGLAMLVAALARTETQVAIYGTLLVLVLAGLSGCMMGDREFMPPQMQKFSRITPHAWALDAYKQLLTNPQPEIEIVATACLVLMGFGAALLALAWWSLRLESDS